ncbi:oligogalacturonate-specific porin KdgM family protein [Chitinilyticum litopenaei]|uniref:oligogalacturonate-specific porin KdgM family protein n=1 Tax=Chitinilyticum litopenaei TaxID=1121276 RepID=UPI00042904A4|nr:oligogalacturonate-specific porin KdgM family protein [Chitinilyticum litopenaei]
MNTKLIALTLALTTAAAAQAASIDFRGQYRTGQERWESRFLLGHELDNGLGGTIEYTINNSSKAGAGLDDISWKDTEFQLYYKYKLNDTITLLPSVLWDSVKSSNNEVYKVGLQANWAFQPGWRLDGRVRYEYNNEPSANLNRQIDNDDWTRTDITLRNTINKEFDAYYNFRWDHKLSNYAFANGSKNNYEHNIGGGYKITKNVRLHGEFGYVGEVQDPNAPRGVLTDDWRFRLGATYTF